ncbi:hypothetical protein IMG5_016340 [Ichthyophthirius multifiliis]|uniref:Transmembrane protein n=1 Tax=Ichthyophthirius multifiliis TaxID=5932 RepID=G0QKD0_ICHMU|nr:hypothetical protein IMG5_016340 [Ichthyophthirius multifiliis]EGR34318.1 hypothetical protein IMG5_016340 [Ichthyophthirius multifiliis]|eukprot:XP_004039622.1 hypothetical protein IMG5_016340 [Ichthyophthirius multifiliis]
MKVQIQKKTKKIYNIMQIIQNILLLQQLMMIISLTQTIILLPQMKRQQLLNIINNKYNLIFLYSTFTIYLKLQTMLGIIFAFKIFKANGFLKIAYFYIILMTKIEYNNLYVNAKLKENKLLLMTQMKYLK